MQRGLQPLAGAHFALIAKPMPIAPSTPLHHEFDRLFNLPLIRIALLDHGDRNAVRAEHDLGSLGIGESDQRFVDLLHQRVQIKSVTIEGFNVMDSECRPET